MTQRTLEERVDALEQAVAALASGGSAGNQETDWKSTIGMFEGDPVMQEIQEEGRKLREADRLRANQDTDS